MEEKIKDLSLLLMFLTRLGGGFAQEPGREGLLLMERLQFQDP